MSSMTNTAEYRRLIEHALFDRLASVTGSCLTSNKAGIQLFALGGDALPEFEAVFTEIVVPIFNRAPSGSLALDALKDLLGPHADLATTFDVPQGLTYLIGAYIVIGTRTDAPRVFRFLRSMPVALLKEAISVTPVFFGEPGEATPLVVRPPESLLNFLQDVATTSGNELRIAAMRAVGKLEMSAGS